MPTAQALRVLSFGIVATRAVGNGVGGDAISAQRANYTFASPRNLTFVRTLFSGNDGWGYRDPTAPVFDGKFWHVWASRIRGDAGGYGGNVWHLYSEALDSQWRDGGIAVNRSDPGAWDGYGVFTPSVAWEGAGGAIVPAPLATKWFLIFGGVSHPQGHQFAFDESLGIATSSSPFGPWIKQRDPIITGRNPNVPWCDPDGPGSHPGVLHVDEGEPYVLNGQRRLYVKTICRNHTVLPSVFVPRNKSSWQPPYEFDRDIRQPVVPPTTTPSGRGFEQARLFLGPDGLLHMTAMAYDQFTPHFISTDGNIGNNWTMVEKIKDWGAGMHELTPVGPPGTGPDAWLGPPGVSGVVEYFIQFAGNPFAIDLLKVNWENGTTSPANRSFTVIGAGSTEFNGIYTDDDSVTENNHVYRNIHNHSLALYSEDGMWRLAVMESKLMYVQALDWPSTEPPLSGWTVARRCNLTAGIRPPSCTQGSNPVGGAPPAPRLAEGWLE